MSLTAAAGVTNKLQIWLLWQSCISFFPRVVSYPIPWTYFSEAKKFENNEIHCNQQYRPCLFHGEALYAEVFCRNGDSQTWIKATVVWKRTLESKVITLANHNCRRYSNESIRTQRKRRQPALSAKRKKRVNQLQLVLRLVWLWLNENVVLIFTSTHERKYPGQAIVS